MYNSRPDKIYKPLCIIHIIHIAAQCAKIESNKRATYFKNCVRL